MSKLSKESRKSSADAYKRRKAHGGIYAVQSSSLGTRWIGQAPDLSTIWNRLTFELRCGSCRHPSLQAAWKTHEPDDFVFEAIEEIDAEEHSFALDRVMKERLDYWCAKWSGYRLG